MAATKTDNHYLADKVAIRVGMLPQKPVVRVLDAFGGRGLVWGAVEKKSGVTIDRVAIDMRTDIDDFHLHGDNIKVMGGLDLSQFDVIDLDAYGVPVHQMELVFKSSFQGVVFVTMIQTMNGAMPSSIVEYLGLPKSITKACPSLVSRRGWEYFCAWMVGNGVKKIRLREKSRKRYFGFRWPQ